MKDNYRAWEIDFGEFYRQASDRDRLKFLVRFAVLAPSSHNSQPWKFEIRDNTILVRPDMRRALPASDANNRQLFISLGCAIENLLIAADYYGFSSDVAYATDGAVITLKRIRQESSEDKKHLIFSIPRRHTNRSPYEDRMPDEGFVAWMQSLGTKDMRIDCITDQVKKDKIADVVVSAGIAAMDDKGFREELSRYVKSNITTEHIGMPMFGFGMPTPLSLIAPSVLKRFNMNRLSRRQDEKLLKEQTPMMVLISTREDNPKTWMEAGSRYERIALMAEQKDIKTAPMAAAIQIGDFYRHLQKILDTDLRPQFFFRIGYVTKATPHSPRIGARAVLS